MLKKGFNQVAYVRFRCGRLTVHCPNVDGEIIYTKKLCDEYPLPEKDKLEIERMLLKRIKPCNNSEV